MPSPSPSPARSPSPSRTRSPSRDRSQTRSPSRSPSPRSGSPRRSVSPRSRSRSRSRTRSRSPRSLSPRRNGRRSYTPNSRSRSRGRSYTRSPTPRDASPAPRSAKIVVEALTRNVKEDHIREIFGKYGVIKDVRMPMNPTCMPPCRTFAVILLMAKQSTSIAVSHTYSTRRLTKPSVQSQKCMTHSWTVPESKFPSCSLDVAFLKPLPQPGEVPRQATDSKTTWIADMDAVDVDHEEEVHPEHTDHRLWMVLHATALHRAACHLIVDSGDEAEVAEGEEEDGEDAHDRTHGPEAARPEGASHALLTAGLRRELRQIEATAVGIARHEEVALAAALAEPEDGEAPVIAPTAATAVGAETADDCTISWAVVC
ncbi:hypothetical protein COCMIDRAFT_4967 [Bipolaris oryzae ATCC 44560]|uniref:RRM domain-containing protein n=1 Tax=Bipolaris oryzae ATCC 44560 TaxID=930090 RepID=W6ZQD0_COCMI|nr:uncharacterized protein COCMIDRAFT_4967 [Bipolaris oryzae ATCC 44560]EUC45931.1 hypothetical protein COCMIDRAFT_4967 [Bipolaris oryzae ATCC 44560]